MKNLFLVALGLTLTGWLAASSLSQELIDTMRSHPVLYAACLENLRNQFTAGYRAHDIFGFLRNPRQPGLPLKTAQGTLRHTGAPYDVAISGKGYFVLEGGLLTRDGAWQCQRGTLVANGGHRLMTYSSQGLQPVTIPPTAVLLEVTALGFLQWCDADGDGKVQRGGQLALARVAHDGWLRHQDWHLKATPESGPPAYGVAGQDGLGTLRQGSLEMPNQNALEQQATAAALRSYAGLTDTP